MPNLHDVIELKKPSNSSTFEGEVNDFLTKVRSSYEVLHTVNAIASKEDFLKKVHEHLEGKRRATFREKLTLPESMCKPIELVGLRDGSVKVSEYTRKDDLGYLSQLPQSSMARMRKTADLLGMVIMPYGALDVRSLRNEGYEVRNSVTYFVNAANAAGLDLYAVAPLRLYNIEQHIGLTVGGDDLYSATHDSTLATISLQLPLFRSMFTAVKALDTRVTALEETSTKVLAQIAALTSRLAALEEKVEESRRIAYEAKVAAEKVAEVAATQRNAWSAVDPMVFATTNGSKLVTEDATVLVGPAWGPDFPPVLLEVCGVKVVKGQRKRIEADFR